MSVINSPGFYTSEAGKCEAVALKGPWAFGVDHLGMPSVWNTDDGATLTISFDRRSDITSPYVEPRKPVEAWCVLFDEEESQKSSFHRTENEAQARWGRLSSSCSARLIHLREVEDEKP